MKNLGRLCCLATLLLLLSPIAAHDVITTKLSYTRDISRIFNRRCLSCHATNSSIPLTTYEEVRPWAVAIKQQVLSRSMPPWGAAKGFGNLSPDRGLSQEEVMIIAAWVIGGSPQGNPDLLPKDKPERASIQPPTLDDALLVQTRSTLPRPVELAGIRPLAKGIVSSARIVADLPDGRIEPLVWLFQYDPKWPQIFRLREPLVLPKGTVIEADSPVQFALESRK